MRLNHILSAALVSIICLGTVSVAQTQDNAGVRLRFLWFSDSLEDFYLTQQILAFQEATGIIVELDLRSNASEVNTVLLEGRAGEAPYPDLARTTIPTEFRGDLLDLRPYLAAPDEWEQNFYADFLDGLRPQDDDNGLYGYPADVTVSAPYINLSLWEEAGVPLPDYENQVVTWDEWIDSATEVQAALTTEELQIYALAFDRSGHRFWGPSLSMCASYITEDGDIVIDTPGFREMAQDLKSWHDNGLVPVDIWQGDSATLVPADEFFIDNQVAFYFSGNWQLDKFDRRINDFEWDVIPNPEGDCGSTGMVGGTTVIAFKDTNHPEEVGALVDFLTEYNNLESFYAQNKLLPGHVGMIENGIEYLDEDMSAQLSRFGEELRDAKPEAFQLQYYPDSARIHGAIRDGLSRMLREDLTIDDAVQIIEQAVGISDPESPPPTAEPPPPAEDAG